MTSIPLPNLDDRRFQDLVDDAKRMVQQRCPEWTDHNVSDPGVTLIETMAYLVDTLLYRVNLIPDKVYLAFLDLIGVHPHPPTAATVNVTFWLSAPQTQPVAVPRGVEVASVRTEQDDAVVFQTTRDAEIPVRKRLTVATQSGAGQLVSRAADLREGRRFGAFSDHPRLGDALLVALDEAAPSCVVALRWDCEVQGIGVNPGHPPLAWEAWNGTEWVACEVERDNTGGLNRPGSVLIHLPSSHAASILGGVRGGWLRTVVTDPAPGYPTYVNSPVVRAVDAFTVGVRVPAIHAREVSEEVIGLSEGIPGQSFPLAHSPVVDDGQPLILEVAAGPGWERWDEVSGFVGHGPHDKVFRVDRTGGRIEFGPAVRDPDGSLAEYGATPPKAAPMRVRAYRTGGGPGGNVAAGVVTVLRTSIPLVERVENRRAAYGGSAAESLDEVRVRGPLDLRTGERAVTTADFEVLAHRASSNVARARCISEAEHGVRLLVVPEVTPDDGGRVAREDLVPPQDLLRTVADYLDARRIVGTRLLIEPPLYQGITVVAQLTARRRYVPDQVREAAIAALNGYFHPITGGPGGGGWPFGRPVHAGEVYSVLQLQSGVELVEDVRLFAADPTTGVRGDPVDRVVLDPNALVYSFGHQVRVTAGG